MPYYSELGFYTGPSSSYLSLNLSSPYANHSSIIGVNNYSRVPSNYLKSTPRSFRGYKPHLSTISERRTDSPLRRLNSPIVSIPIINVPRPIKINTVDIDVSVNKYRKYDRSNNRANKSETNDVKTRENKSPSPSAPESPRGSFEAKPTAIIKRERATVRLKTIHKDKLPLNETTYRKWREKIDFEELDKQEQSNKVKKSKKSPGELLKEKFLIQHKNDVKISKSPSFHEICTAITTDAIDEELNPGQPVEVQRRQSRHFLDDDIFKEVRRTSTDLSEDEVNMLDTILEERARQANKNDNAEESRESKKRRKYSRTFSNQNLTLVPKSSIQRRPSTQKKIKKNCLENIVCNDIQKEDQNKVEDIDKVQTEKIKKPKPIITATVNIEEPPSPILKLIVDEVEIVETPKLLKKGNKLKFNFTTEEIQENISQNDKLESKLSDNKGSDDFLNTNLSFDKKQVNCDAEDKTKTSSISKANQVEKTKRVVNFEINEMSDGILHFAKHKEPVILEIIQIRQHAQLGTVLEPLGEAPKKVVKTPKKIAIKTKRTINTEDKEQLGVVQMPKSNKVLVSEAIIKQEHGQKGQILETNNNKTNIKNLNFEKTKKKIEKQLKASKLDNNEKNKTNKPEQTEQNCIIKEKLELESEELIVIQLATEDSKTIAKSCEIVEISIENKSVISKKITSKRSLIQKPNKDDPDLHVFEVPEEPEPKEPEEEPKDVFVPLQSNRLSQFMHPFKKPEQLNECPVNIFARPKTIRKRHNPRGRFNQFVVQRPPPVRQPSPEESSEEESDSSSEEEETSSEENYKVQPPGKVGASTSSNDSGFDSGVPGASDKGSSSESRDSPSSAPSSNPAFAIDDLEEYSQSSTFASFQKSGRITPPATTIPRFRKYCAEDFNFLKVLGKGTFGKVLLAELKDTEYYYAVKCLKKDVVLEDDDVECTLIERKVLALGTKHPYLCHLLCTFQNESHLFFVMEYLNGGDLMFHIQQSGRFSEARARFYGAEIVSGLKFLHTKGIVYRDLKLDNILLDFDGHVRIADFGMCKLQIFLDRMADTFCGTPDYMAPEIIKGQHYNQSVDWWSFGVLLYEMLLGQSPFSGCDEEELFWSICNEKPVLPRFLSPEASSVLSMLLEKNANNRLGNRFCSEGDIVDQPFFKPINWDQLEARLLEAPFKPNLAHPLDTKYFDKTFTTEEVNLTPIEQHILDSMDQTQFQGFSYTNPNATDK